MRDIPALLPRSPLQERSEPRGLRKAVELIEAAENRMIGRQIDDLPVRKDALELTLDISPFDGSVKIVECQRASAEEKVAQDRRFDDTIASKFG